MGKLLLTDQEAADYLALSTRTLKNWRSNKTGPNYYRLNGRVVRYREEDLDRWLEEQQPTGGRAA